MKVVFPIRSFIFLGLFFMSLAGCGGGDNPGGTEPGTPVAGDNPVSDNTQYSVDLSWDANVEPDVTGYYVHYGVKSNEYSEKIWVDNVTMHNIVVTGARNHYFSITAINSNGYESNFSQEIVVNTAI